MLAVGTPFTVFANKKYRVTWFESGGSTFQVDSRIPLLSLPRLRQLRLERVPGGLCLDLFNRLKRLWQLTWTWNTLYFRANIDGRLARSSLCIFHGKGQKGAGRDAGSQLIADESRKLNQRDPLGCCSQVGLVGNALLVEGEHIGDRCPGIEKRDREVIVITRFELLERQKVLGKQRETRQHAVFELRMRADAIGNSR